jgi:hypothetical protein
VLLATAAVQQAVERGELGEPFDAALAAFARARASISVVHPEYRIVAVWEAFGRSTG